MKYIAPELELLVVETVDVMTASGGSNNNPGGGDTGTPDDLL